MTTPTTLAIYWGSMPDFSDTASTLSFDTPEELGAYFRGLDEANGYMEVNFVEHSRYYVNKDDEIVARAGTGPEPKATERYAIWGEDPERGTRAQTYAFDSEAEANAFQQGGSDMVGWATHFCVPSDEFKPCPDLKDVRAFLDKETFKAFESYAANRGGLDSLVFVRADGAFVDGDWALGHDVENEPAPPKRKPRGPGM